MSVSIYRQAYEAAWRTPYRLYARWLCFKIQRNWLFVYTVRTSGAFCHYSIPIDFIASLCCSANDCGGRDPVADCCMKAQDVYHPTGVGWITAWRYESIHGIDVRTCIHILEYYYCYCACHIRYIPRKKGLPGPHYS